MKAPPTYASSQACRRLQDEVCLAGCALRVAQKHDRDTWAAESRPLHARTAPSPERLRVELHLCSFSRAIVPKARETVQNLRESMTNLVEVRLLVVPFELIK